jgi:hypothetical protein
MCFKHNAWGTCNLVAADKKNSLQICGFAVYERLGQAQDAGML